MTETREALGNLDAILRRCRGVDAVFFGPNDLSFSLGASGQMGHPDVVAAIEHGVARALAHNIAPGVLALTPDDLPSLAQRRRATCRW